MTNIPASPPAGMDLRDWGRLVNKGYREHFLPPSVAVSAVMTPLAEIPQSCSLRFPTSVGVGAG